MIDSVKEEAMADMALIASLRGHLIGYAELEEMHDCVVSHHSIWRRFCRYMARLAPPSGETS